MASILNHPVYSTFALFERFIRQLLSFFVEWEHIILGLEFSILVYVPVKQRHYQSIVMITSFLYKMVLFPHYVLIYVKLLIVMKM